MELKKVRIVLVLKSAAFNLPNDHATNSACLNDRAIIANFQNVCRLKRMIEWISNFLVGSTMSKASFGQVERVT